MAEKTTNRKVTWGELADIAREIMAALFKADALDSELKYKAKYAASVLSSASRHESNELVAERTAYEVGVRLIEDREGLLEYIKQMAPRLRSPLEKANIEGRVKSLTLQVEQARGAQIEAQEAVIRSKQ